MRQKVKWVLLGIFIVYTLAGSLLLPYLLEKKLPSLVETATGGRFSVENISFHPFWLELSVEGVRFADPRGEEVATLKNAVLNLDFSSLFVGAVKVRALKLTGPSVNIVRFKEGGFNFDWLMKPGEEVPARADGEKESTALPRIIIKLFAIEAGTISYLDRSRAEPFDVTLGPIGFELENVDTADMENTKDTIHLYSAISDGGFININSEILSLSPPALKGRVDFKSGELYTQWRYLQEMLKLEVADGKIDLSFDFSVDGSDPEAMRLDNLRFALKNLRIKPKTAYHDLLRIGSMTLDDGVVEPLRQRAGLKRVRVDNVAVFVKRDSNGDIDWQSYVQTTAPDAEAKTSQEPTEPSSKPWLVTLDQLALGHIMASFADAAVSPETTFTLDTLRADMRHISSQPGAPLDYNLSLLLNGAMRCQSGGTIVHSPLDMNMTAECAKIDLTWVRPYIDAAAQSALERFDIQLHSGELAFDVDARVSEKNATLGVRVADANAALKGLSLRQRSSDTQLFELEELRIGGVRADTVQKQAGLGSVLMQKPQVYLVRDKDGGINVSELIVPKRAQNPTAEGGAVPSAKEAEWTAELKRFAIKKGSVAFEDRMPAQAAGLAAENIEVGASDIRSKPGSPLTYSVSMNINKKARFKAEGTLRHTPLEQKGDMSLEGLELADFNPYIAEYAHIGLSGGRLSFRSITGYGPSESGPDLSVKGRVALSGMKVHDRRDQSLLLAFDEVAASPFLFEYAPDSLFIDEVKIAGLYANVFVDENRSLNLASLMKTPPPEEAETADNASSADVNTTKKPFPVKVLKVSIAEGSSDFADFSLPLRFRTHIRSVNGTLYALSSMPEETSFVDIDGVVDRYGSAKLKGSVDSADPKRFSDLNLQFRNLAMNAYSPYSANFAGRKIDEGKLYLDLGYHIVDSQLKADNSIVIKKIRLGEAVESKEAVSLPLGLAIALLEDSDGVIDIDMPIEGDVDSPDFKYGAMVWKTLGNLITKAVTAPFRFLGALLGIEGDKLETVEFAPGSDLLLPPEQEKLDTLSKALKKRPRLLLGVAGGYDSSADAQTMKVQKVQAAAMALLRSKKGDERAKVLTVPVLETLYARARGEQALGIIQQGVRNEQKDISLFVPRYRQRLLDELAGLQEITEEELAALGASRARNIMTYLDTAQGIAADRVQTREAHINSDASAKWVPSKLSIEIK